MNPSFQVSSDQMDEPSTRSLKCRATPALNETRDQLLSHLETHQVLTPNQHGLTKRRSCRANLLETVENWTKILDEEKGLDVLYLDYQKAFDIVPHKRLLSKLKWYGVDGNLI